MTQKQNRTIESEIISGGIIRKNKEILERRTPPKIRQASGGFDRGRAGLGLASRLYRRSPIAGKSAGGGELALAENKNIRRSLRQRRRQRPTDFPAVENVEKPPRRKFQAPPSPASRKGQVRYRASLRSPAAFEAMRSADGAPDNT
jgi:hypothetical protein